MQTIKDTHNSLTKQYDTAFALVSHISLAIPDSSYRTLADRAQKIVTATYMISDLLVEDIVMRDMLRTKSVLAMQSLFDNVAANGDALSLKNAQQYFYEMLSYLDILFRTGSLSEMNYSILINVVHTLQGDIKDQQTKLSSMLPAAREIDGLSLDSFFKEKNHSHKESEHEHTAVEQKTVYVEKPIIAHTSRTVSPVSEFKKEIVKQGETPTIKFEKNVLETVTAKKESKVSAKDKRHENITKILRQKKDASINDICALFDDCSSKTIQRDLNEMIDNGLVMKRGDRRWSVYNLK